MNRPEDSLAFDDTWVGAPFNSAFCMLQTPSPYPESHYSMPQYLEPYPSMPFAITDTDQSCTTDADFQLLSSAHGQEGLALLANGALSPLSNNDMTFCHGNMTLLPSALTGAFQPTLDDNFPGTSPTQAIGVQQPTPEVHANALLHQTPDHPELLPGVEFTNSDGNVGPCAERPHGSSSDSDTYSCTQRSETMLDLQRSKRNVHQQTLKDQNREASASSAAAQKSQADPHKCKRINPSTGKPCTTTFSRSYDLTRHEDTLHNTRKQKIKCSLCPEEKTFARNDALTRHMRCVHPEVQLPGKHLGRRKRD